MNSGQTIKYFQNKYELDAFIQYEVPGKISWDVRVHHSQPDAHLPSKAERINRRRDDLIDGLLNG